MAKFNRDAFVIDDLEEKVTLTKQQMNLYGGAENRETVMEIPLDHLKRSAMNHFTPITGEKWEEFLASVREQGILNPILVREISLGKYEILAGHNRVRAAKEVGLELIPAIVRDVDDVEASFIIADTNLQREEVTDLEKGWAYRNIYEAIARSGQGKRNDLLCGHDDHEVGEGRKSSEIIAEKYDIGEKTVRRKIRLTYLLAPLYSVYADKKITQEVAEQFSYLRDQEQSLIESMIRQYGRKFDLEAAKAIRKASEKSERPLSDVDMSRIAGQEAPTAANALLSKPKRYKVEDALFPRDVKKGEREDYISKALRYVQENGIEL